MTRKLEEILNIDSSEPPASASDSPASIAASSHESKTSVLLSNDKTVFQLSIHVLH
mgnify:CR=1 FL=1